MTHEIVRHRIASYSQESTRYCNYSDEKFGSELTFIRPVFLEKDTEKIHIWEQSMQNIEDLYNKLIEMGAQPQMRQIASQLLTELKEKIPVIFDDILIED